MACKRSTVRSRLAPPTKSSTCLPDPSVQCLLRYQQGYQQSLSDLDSPDERRLHTVANPFAAAINRLTRPKPPFLLAPPNPFRGPPARAAARGLVAPIFLFIITRIGDQSHVTW
jgi:hypothetical protein